MQIAMMARVTGGSWLPLVMRTARGLAARTHSGHWNPTGALIMHSVQIGWPHLAHDTAASRVGWR
jgi:hypothetical protein